VNRQDDAHARRAALRDHVADNGHHRGAGGTPIRPPGCGAHQAAMALGQPAKKVPVAGRSSAREGHPLSSVGVARIGQRADRPAKV